MTVVRLLICDVSGTLRLCDRRGPLHVHVDDRRRETPATVVDAIRARFGLEVAFLRVASTDTVEVELLDDGPLPNRFGWREHTMSPVARRRVAWQRPGWLRDVLDRVDAALTARGVRRTAPPVQWRHSSISAILRLGTDRGRLWLKAIPDAFAHEGPVVDWLSRITPDAVPSVVASGRDWWVSEAFPPRVREPREDWLEALARLQVAAIPRTGELAGLGCPLRTPSSLARDVAALARREGLIGRQHAASLWSSLPALEALCARVETVGVPSTLVHGDLHAGNARWTRLGWLLFDWTDACVAHPFVDLALPLSYERPVEAARRAAAYAACWAGVLGDREIEYAMRLAPALGAAHQVASYMRLLDAVGSSVDPSSVRRARDWIERLAFEVRSAASWLSRGR